MKEEIEQSWRQALESTRQPRKRLDDHQPAIAANRAHSRPRHPLRRRRKEPRRYLRAP
jgi:hypothetical protein